MLFFFCSASDRQATLPTLHHQCSLIEVAGPANWLLVLKVDVVGLLGTFWISTNVWQKTSNGHACIFLRKDRLINGFIDRQMNRYSRLWLCLLFAVVAAEMIEKWKGWSTYAKWPQLVEIFSGSPPSVRLGRGGSAPTRRASRNAAWRCARNAAF